MATGWGKRVQKEMQNNQMGKTPDTTPAGIVWISLHTADPSDDGQTANEATGVGYARVSMVAADWNAATDAQPTVTDNLNAATFPTAGGDWSSAANMTHFGIWNDATGTAEADYVGRGLLTTAAPVLNGQTPNFPAGALRMRGTETP